MCAPTENISTDRIGGRACVELGVSAAVMEGRHEKGEAGVGNSSKGRNSGRCEYVVRCDVLRAYRYAKAGGSWFKTWNSWDRAALVGALQGSHRGPSCESQAQGILTYFSDL